MVQNAKPLPTRTYTQLEVAKLVAAAQAAKSTFDTLRREGTSFSREAYIKGYVALIEALSEFDFVKEMG